MLDSIKLRYRKEMFFPSYIAVATNPFYFIRKGLYCKIIENRDYMQGVLLDFGCGNKPYRDIFNCVKYIGLDIAMDDKSRQNPCADIYYDGGVIPFNDNHFDSIFSSEVFEHIINLEETVNELYRVIRPGGYILITVPFVWHEHAFPFDFARYTSFGIGKVLEKAGFSIVRSERTTNYVETMFQLSSNYIFEFVFPRNKYIRALLTPFVLAPLNLCGILLASLLPMSETLYHNSVVVARKPEIVC